MHLVISSCLVLLLSSCLFPKNLYLFYFSQDNLSVVEKEKESLQRRISEMHIDINKLRDELEKGVERERLLVSYPDLHKSHSLQVIESKCRLLW